MNIDTFNDLPEWDDKSYRDDDGEQWKPGSTREACKALYRQWQQVFFLLKGITTDLIGEGAAGNDDMERDFVAEAARNIIADALLAGVKIKSSEAGDMYVLRMENAAIIRKCAADIYSSLLLFMHDPDTDGEHIAVIRKEIDKFRELFIYWVCSFEKDEFADEWGLFI
ncbi:hypothetical protein ACTHGU_18320 [Chitinophagaceae bacterium MMS25-I14]